jgi:hypothetical protein
MKMGLERRLVEKIPEISEVVQSMPEGPQLNVEEIEKVTLHKNTHVTRQCTLVVLHAVVHPVSFRPLVLHNALTHTDRMLVLVALKSRHKTVQQL